jgi:hypothetical protein
LSVVVGVGVMEVLAPAPGEVEMTRNKTGKQQANRNPT